MWQVSFNWQFIFYYNSCNCLFIQFNFVQLNQNSHEYKIKVLQKYIFMVYNNFKRHSNYSLNHLINIYFKLLK